MAIARALVTQPSLVLADEPTGNLDSRTTEEVMALFQEINAQGVTVIIVTHESHVAAYCHRVVELHDGQIARNENVMPHHALTESNATAHHAMSATESAAPDVA